jgi:hypothetical protein
MTIFTQGRSLQEARTAALLLSVRGLQLQAAGNDEAFVNNLRSGLALSRNLRHSSLIGSAQVGRGVESTMLEGTDCWLEELDGHPELLRRVRDILLTHEKETPPFGQPQQKAEYLVALNSLEDPPKLIKLQFVPTRATGKEASLEQAEDAVVTMAWLVPWEKERHERLLRALFEGDPSEVRVASEMARGALPFFPVFPNRRFLEEERRQMCDLHASQLKVALRLYQAENGKPAASLGELVRKQYLKAIPTDPFDGQPFRYRLSKEGEAIVWPEDNPPEPAPGAAAAAGAPGGLLPAMPAAGGLPNGPGEAVGMVAGPGAVLLEPGMPGMGMPPLPVEPTREVPPGQGILWSVGEDGQDDGGKRQFDPRAQRTSPGEDRIYLVPLPPKK